MRDRDNLSGASIADGRGDQGCRRGGNDENGDWQFATGMLGRDVLQASGSMVRGQREWSNPTLQVGGFSSTADAG